VNVRPRVAAPQPGIPIVKAAVDRSRVPLGELVTFTLTPASVVSDSRYTVTIYFGDGQREQVRQPKLTHLYSMPGTFTYSILVKSISPKLPLAVPTVELSVTPTSVETGALVNFKASLSLSYPNLKYRFVFADGVQSDWQDDPTTTHGYKLPNTYRPYVDIGSGKPGSIMRLGGSLRRAIIVSSPKPVTVELTADRLTIPARTEVNFLARPDSSDPSLRYHFVFGDGSRPTAWQPSPQAKHFYPKAGSYPAYVEVRVLNRSGQQARSRTLSIDVAPVPGPVDSSIDLLVSPRSIPEGFPVYFRAISNSRKRNATYRFNFGDGSPQGSWEASAETFHVYALAGTYRTFVEVSRANDPIAASAIKQLTVTPFLPGPTGSPTPGPTPSASPSPSGTATPSNSPVSSPSPNASVTPFASPNASPTVPAITSTSPSPTASPSVSPSPSPSPAPLPDSDPWKYLPLVPLVLFGGYQGWKYFYAPRPTLETRPDPGAAVVGTEGGPLGINFQMELDPNVTDGEFSVDTSEKTLIKSERKSDG
jgi:hypothetical protein